MKIVLLGISIILFSIACILTSGGTGTLFSFAISLVGLLVSIIGCLKNDG